MTRAVVGSDFLQCLRELFQEASQKGFQSDEQFAFLKTKVLKLLIAVSQTTAARARASCPIELPDGSEPDTFIQLPPSTFKIDDCTNEKLELATTGEGFVRVLEEAFEALRGKKRKNGVQRGNTVTARKRIKIVDVRTPKKDIKTGAGEEKTGPAQQTYPSPAATIAEPQQDIDPETGESVTATEEQGTMVPAALSQEAFPMADRAQTTDQGVVSSVPVSAYDIFEEENLPGGISEDIHMESDNDDPLSRPPAIPDSPLSTFAVVQNDKPAGDIVDDFNEHMNIQTQLIATMIKEAMEITPQTWKSWQPELLKGLDRLKDILSGQMASLEPALTETRVQSLEGALDQLTKDISMIPDSNWITYRKKLVQFCTSEQIRPMSFPQRLYKVMDIIYLPEESQAIPNGEWDRMMAVARVCAVVTEAMGPEDEDAEHMAEKWLASKSRDLVFLRKIMKSVKRANEIMPPSGGN